jgi:ubiquinone/menaquinone biosynthesis C-methylase UbiE
MSKSFSWLSAQKLERKYWEMELDRSPNVNEESLDRFSKMLSLFNDYALSQSLQPEFRLDVGCGPYEGIFSVLETSKAKCTNVGVDSQLYQRRKSSQIAPIVATAEKLPIRSQAFDVVFCINALDPQRILLRRWRKYLG